VLGTPAQREELRAQLGTWAYAPTRSARNRARDRLEQIATHAATSAPEAFGDDALRPSRIAFGAAHMVSYEARDHEALHALYTLPGGNLEDTQLAQFGLLLMTRLDPTARDEARSAIKSLSSHDEARRDVARSQLGRLLTRCLRPDQTDQPSLATGDAAASDPSMARPTPVPSARRSDPPAPRSETPMAPQRPVPSRARTRQPAARTVWAALLVGLAAASLVVAATLVAQRSAASAAPDPPPRSAEPQP